MIDVLSLGVKNDGSEDISSIVNAATERDTLFFPGRAIPDPLIV